MPASRAYSSSSRGKRAPGPSGVNPWGRPQESGGDFHGDLSKKNFVTDARTDGLCQGQHNFGLNKDYSITWISDS